MKEVRESIVLENQGQKIFAVQHLPLDVINPPVVVLSHGFASNKLGTNRAFVTIAQKFSEAGIATLRFDTRGCGDSEGHLSEMTLEAYISDLLVVCHHLEQKGYSKICLFGSSFGGSLAILGAARLKNILSIALWAPVASGALWIQDFIKSNPTVDPLKNYKGIPLHPQFLEQFGKMEAHKTLASLGKIPLLHFQGEKDETISLAHQRAFQEGRKGASAASRFITYPETDHKLGYAKVFPEVVEECIKWFTTV